MGTPTLSEVLAFLTQLYWQRYLSLALRKDLQGLIDRFTAAGVKPTWSPPAQHQPARLSPRLRTVLQQAVRVLSELTGHCRRELPLGLLKRIEALQQAVWGLCRELPIKSDPWLLYELHMLLAELPSRQRRRLSSQVHLRLHPLLMRLYDLGIRAPPAPPPRLVAAPEKRRRLLP
jgi:hypothetical protein